MSTRTNTTNAESMQSASTSF